MLILSRLKSGKYKKLFISEKKLLKLFLQTVESSFDYTMEVFMTKPEKILLNVQKRSSKQFYSQKKRIFSPKSFPWTRGNFFDKFGKFLAQGRKTWAKHYFSKKVYLVKNFLWTCTMQFWQPRQKTSTKGQKTCAQCPKTIRNNIKFSILGKVSDWTVPMDA